MHVDGDHLESLSAATLHVTLKADDTDPTIDVYMNLATDHPQLRARRDAVVTYFEDRGVTTDNIEFKSGSNTEESSLAVQHLSRLKKTESNGDDADSESESMSA